MAYRVIEIFYSLQGEGFHTGKPAVFVRMSGCNRACPFCDTDFAAYTEMTLEEIVAEVQKYPARHVVLTGGEPTLQVDDALLDALKDAGAYVQIETNGTRPVPSGVDWVTCSPKTAPWGIDRVDELKVVYQGGLPGASIAKDSKNTSHTFASEETVEAIADGFAPLGVKVYSLQPCSGLNIAETVRYVQSHPRWRLSLQTHKLIDIK